MRTLRVRFRLDDDGNVWCAAPFDFANDLALAPDGGSLLVAELTGFLPDGLAFDSLGNLYVGCYEPSAFLCVTPEGSGRTLVADSEAHPSGTRRTSPSAGARC